MVNVQAKTREEYFQAAGEREPILRELDKFIRQTVPTLKPVIFGGMSGTWLGYGMQPYQTKSMKEPTEWPVLALANQKNYLSLYVMATEDGEYVAEKYAKDLGKVNVGKSCIRFKKLEDLDLEVLEKMLKGVEKRFEKEGAIYT